ncbi:monocarboxylate transporter 12-like [Patiria miniata]|uniref:Major facilitator superfamily (MFS) profile domain-containing protein n=1 Tax=Patiria miniata TaxID=46514 RepID=A0A914BGV7_PATMI|nr:monocarboxylate transporter 12-like [Patiria miniata]
MGKAEVGGSSRQGWCAVFCLFVSWLLWSVILKSLGVMLPTLQEQFAAQTWLIGWMISIINGVIYVSGLFAKPLEVMFGARTVVTVGGFLVGISMIIASFSTSVVMLTLTLALLAGPSMSVVNILSRSLMGRHFTTHYATANGIGTSGASVGLIIVAPFTQLLLNTYGWRGTFLILGGFSLHLGVCGALLQSPPTDETKKNGEYQSLGPDIDEAPVVSSPSAEETGNSKLSSRLITFKDAICAQMSHFGFSVCLRVPFWITTVIFCCSNFCGAQWYIYYISQAEAKGFSPYDAVTFTTAAGVGNLLIKILSGPIVDRGLLKLRPAIVLTIMLSSSALLITPLVNSYWLMMANASIFYGAFGAVVSLNDLYTRELLGTDLLACAFAWMELVTAVLCFSLGFFPGWLYDQSGSYDLSFVILGCISYLSLAALMVEWFLARWSDGKSRRNTEREP